MDSLCSVFRVIFRILAKLSCSALVVILAASAHAAKLE